MIWPFYFVAVVAMSSIFIGVGLKVLLTKRPLVLSSKILRGITLISVVIIITRPNHAGVSFIFIALMWVFILAMIWRQSSGYSIFGVSNPAFRESLVATLHKMGVVFNEDMTGIEIPSEGIKLETFSTSNGLSRIGVKDKSKAEWLKKLALALKEYYAVTPVTMTFTYSIFYTAIGFLMLAAMVSVFFTHHQ